MTDIRTATFLAIQLRVDAKRKTSNTIKCKPPNKRCGRRCIPAEWDCRIKGEGHDTHQRASNFDPLSGAANIQRGTKRVAKGIVTGNVAEVEGGTRAIKRGIVKSIPGDVEKKKRVRESLDKNTRNLTIGLALVTGGFALHNVMKKGWPAYASGPGRDLDDSIRVGVSSVMDRVPGIGGIRAEQRQQAQGAGLQIANRLNNMANRGPDALTQQLADVPETVRNGGIGHNGRNNVLAALNRTATEASTQGQSFEDWRRNSREAVLNTTVAGRSIFADDATYQFLSRQHGLVGQRTASLDSDIAFLQSHMAGSLANQSQALKRDALNQGFSIQATGRDSGRKRGEARTQYVDQIIRRDFAGAPTQFQNQMRAQLRDLINKPDGHDFTSDAAKLYRDTRSQFNLHFRALADYAAVPAGTRTRPEQRNLIEHVNIVHAQVLHTRLPGALRDVQIAGPSHAEFIQQYSYDTSVMGNRTSSPSARMIKAAAEDMAGYPMTGLNNARDYLRQQGYTQLSTVTPTAFPRSRPRGDVADRPSPAYIAAYMETMHRYDAGKGKPCGESYIPQAHKCGKQSVATSAGRTETFANEHDAQYKTKAIASFFARVGITAGAGVMAYKSAQDVIEGKSINTFAPMGYALIASLGVASLVREQKVTKSPERLAAELQELKRAQGVEPETLDKLSKFVLDSQIDVRRVGTKEIIVGMAGYFDTAKPDRVHTVGGFGTHDRTYKSKDPVDAIDNGLRRFIEDRSALSTDKQDARNITNTREFRRNFAVSGYIGNNKGAVTAITIHELGHALHYRGDFATPKSVRVNGKEYSGAELQAELIRSSSIYGQSDVRRAIQPQPGSYYQQGNRLETFTENFVLYAANGKNMKEAFPVSYAWTKATVDYALAKPAKKSARPFTDVFRDLAKGTERFNPDKVLPKPKTRAKEDSAEDDRFFAFYKEMQEAATSGDVLKSIQVLARAQVLPQAQKQMIGALMETACLYRSLRDLL
jgi:hypothetical protein